MKHVLLVTMEGKKNSLPSCYSVDTLTGFGAQVKGHRGKCSIKIAFFLPIRICAPSLWFQLLLTTTFLLSFVKCSLWISAFHRKCVIYLYDKPM